MKQRYLLITTIIMFLTVATLSYLLLDSTQKLSATHSNNNVSTTLIEELKTNLEKNKLDYGDLLQEKLRIDSELSMRESQLSDLKIRFDKANEEIISSKLETHELVIDTRLDNVIIDLVITYFQAINEKNPDKYLAVTWYDDINDINQSLDWIHLEERSKLILSKIEVGHFDNENYITIYAYFHNSDGMKSLAAIKRENKWLLVEPS